MTEIINIPIARETRVDTQSESSKTRSTKTEDQYFAKLLNKVESTETQIQQIKNNTKTENQPVKVDGNKDNNAEQKQPVIEDDNKKFDSAQEVPALVLMAMQNLTPQISNQQQIQQIQNEQSVKTETEEKADKSIVSQIETKTTNVDELLIKTAISQMSDANSAKTLTAEINPITTNQNIDQIADDPTKELNPANAVRVQSELSNSKVEMLNLDNKAEQPTNAVSAGAIVNKSAIEKSHIKTDADKPNMKFNTADLANQLAKSEFRELAYKETFISDLGSDLKYDSKSVKEAFFTLSSASANAIRVQSELNIGGVDQLSSSFNNKVELTTNTASVAAIPISASQTSSDFDEFAGTTSQDNQNAAFVAQLSSKSVEKTDTPKEIQAAVRMPDSELRQRIIDQVVHEVKLSKLADRSDLVIRLTPPELGTLKIKMMQDSSGMTTQIQTSSEQVKNLLQTHIPAIVESLSNAGIKLDKVTVAYDVAFNSFAKNFSQSNAENQTKQSARNNQSFARQIDGVDTLTSASMIRNEAIGSTAYNWLA